jgi:ppGpp synthetase/RelA/SpoT-type nucleotidyltranferase
MLKQRTTPAQSAPTPTPGPRAGLAPGSRPVRPAGSGSRLLASQEGVERRAARRSCPVCREADDNHLGYPGWGEAGVQAVGSRWMAELSRSQIDKLGRRLRRAGPNNLSDEDRDLLEVLLASYAPVLSAVHEQLTKAVGLPVTPRLKTTGTLVEKLQRNPNMALSRMQDIAGARLVAEMNWTEQDQLVARIAELFPGAQVTDRRAMPSYGYRAVHVIVEVDQWFVEIQVRTALQNLWAQVFERLADRWGRGIRYGDPPIDPDLEVVRGFTRRKIVELMMRESERAHKLEEVDVELLEYERDPIDPNKFSAAIDTFPELETDPGMAQLVQAMREAPKTLQWLREQHRTLEEQIRKALQLLRGLE